MATKAIIELILKDAKFNAALKKSKKEMGRISGQRKFVKSMKDVGVAVTKDTKGMRLRAQENGRYMSDLQALDRVEGKKLAKQQSIIAGQASQRKSLQMLSKQTGLTMSEVKSRIGKMNGEWDKNGNLVNAATKKTIINTKQMAMGVKKVGKEMKSASFVAKTGGRAFAGWAMSIMFAGMVIMRTFQMITKATVGTYMKIAEGTTEASRGILRLSAEFEYLKYVVGNAIATAIGPLIPKLVEWMRWIGAAAKEHPKLTSSIILGGLAFGFFAMTLGQTILGINGFIDLAGHLGRGLKWIKALTWSNALAYVGWAAAIVVAMAAIYMIAKVLKNPKSNGMEKFLATLALVSAAIIIPALMFGLWPVALAAAIVGLVALMLLFKDRTKTALGIMGLDFRLMVAGWRLEFARGLGDLEVQARQWVNEIIKILNKVPFVDISEVSEFPSITSGMTNELAMQVNALNAERKDLVEAYNEMETPGETMKRVFLGGSGDYIADINAKYGPGKNKVPMEYWGTSSLKYGTVDGKGNVVTPPGQVSSSVQTPTMQSSEFSPTGLFDTAAMGEVFGGIEALRPAGAGETAAPTNNYNIDSLTITTKEDYAEYETTEEGLADKVSRLM